MEKELISVIIPFYNASNYLDDLFLSLSSQTYKNVEYIFVDDGSKDDTFNKLTSLNDKYNLNAHILSQTNSGPSVARNKGLAIASGSLIYFGDADDILHPHILEILEKLINSTQADLACCKTRRVNSSYKYVLKTPAYKEGKIKTFDGPCEILSVLWSTKMFGFPAFNKLFRMSILKQLPTFPNVWNKDVYFGEDLLFSSEYCLKCNRAVYTNRVLYSYRLSKNSLVRTKFTNKKLTTFKIVDFYNSLDKTQFGATEPYYKTYICFTCMDFLLQIAKSDFDDKTIIRKLYSEFKQTLKYCKKGKINPWYRKYFMWTTVPIVKVAIRKKIKDS